MITFLLFVIAIVAYMLGGLNGAIIASKTLYRNDVRRHGSHNAGLTNYLRTFGPGGVAIVLLTDVLKSVLAILFGGWLLGTQGFPVTGKIFACFCLMLGHIWPVIYQFRGGKGVLCAGVAVLMVDWRMGLMCWAVFLACVIFTRYVSLGSICCSIFFPIGLLFLGYRGIDIWLALFCALLLIGKHEKNIRRLIKGEESRFSLGQFRGGNDRQ